MRQAAPTRSLTKERIPPGPAARAAAGVLRALASGSAADEAKEVVIDLARYAAAAQGRNTLQP